MEILFDLDGTLTDSAPGITRCIQEALRRLGRAVPETDSLRRFVGPPLPGTFALLLESTEEEEVAQAIRLYRERFVTTGMFENALYPGVREGLERLRGRGHRLWVATSKPEVYARQILEHFGIAHAFAGVHGPDLTGRNHDKRELIRELLLSERVSAPAACMVGDRALDVEGARANGLSAVAVLWGCGTAEELRAAEPDFMVETFAELCSYFERDDMNEVHG